MKMEWTESIRRAVAYMEANLQEKKSAEDVAAEVAMSSFYLQRGFKIMTGYTMAEYVRGRRLYMAALDVIADWGKVIDIALKYGYETPESFTKAFTRFHGLSPMQLKKAPQRIRIFLPLKIRISIQGGNDMDYTVEKMTGFQVIGFEREFHFETGYQEIPRFWNEWKQNYMVPLMQKGAPETALEKVLMECQVGEFGVCIDDLGKEHKFRYLIAGTYHGGEVPEGMTVYEFPDMEWAKFSCRGRMPEALQSVNTKIFQEWLPGNTEYEIAMGANVEWYNKGDMTSADYESAIWVPVKRK